MDEKEMYVQVYAAALSGLIAKGDFPGETPEGSLNRYRLAASEANKYAREAFPVVLGVEIDSRP